MLLLSVALVGLLPLVTPQCLTPNDNATAAGNTNDPKLQLYEGQIPFALNMLQTLSAQNPQTNMFFSPLSVYSTLLLAYFISANHTEQTLHQVLNIPKEMTKVNVLEAFKAEQLLDQSRVNQESYQLINSHRLFVSAKLKVRECMEKLFSEELEKLDFEKDVVAASEHINQWVETQTKGQIKDLIPVGHLSPESKLVLANSAYFKGSWKSKFMTNRTKKEIFHISSSQKTLVTMMKQKGTFNYLVSETLGAHVLQLPYLGSSISMFVFLPPYAAPQGLNNILKHLTPEYLQQILSEEIMVPKEVEIGFPRFKVERTLELVPILASMGVGDLFNDSANLSLLTGESGIQLNDAIHKAKIQVDEKGTTAAAATAFFSFRSSRPLSPVMFICNHPFIYLLYDGLSKTVLFTGVYNSPPPAE